MSVEIAGPEGRNVLGKFAEKELRAFFEHFAGWDLLAANRDFCGRGLDFLFSYDDPYTGYREGVLVDSKHVEDGEAFAPSSLQEKLKALYAKFAVFAGCEPLWTDDNIRGRMKHLRFGIAALRFHRFDRDRYTSVLKTFDPTGMTGAQRLPVMITLANDRLAAFLGLKQFAPGARIEWRYFRYLKNEHQRNLPVLSASMLVSDIIPGVLRTGDSETRFVLAFQEPAREFFEYFGSFEKHFQFDPQYYLFARGRADQEERYKQYLPREQSDREIHIVGGADLDLNVDLARVFS